MFNVASVAGITTGFAQNEVKNINGMESVKKIEVRYCQEVKDV